MKLLAFSDFHGLYGLSNPFRDIKRKIVEVQPDILIFCGDFRNQISIPLLESRLRRLKCPHIYYVWGNSDALAPDFALTIGVNLHLKLHQLTSEFTIAGIGGDELDLQRNIQQLDARLSQNKTQLILISHIPPFGFCDFAVDQKHVGSKPLRALIEKYSPKIHLFGHIHEEAQKCVRSETTIFWNVGPQGIVTTF